MDKLKLEKGKLLISEPFLYDSNFKRSVILLCQHSAEGDMGFILNKPLELKLHDVVDIDKDLNIPVYFGGPVQQNTLHFIHRRKDMQDESELVMPGLYWGGNFEVAKLMLETHAHNVDDYRFFIGYSGWGNQQLEAEMQEKSWIVNACTLQEVFNPDADYLWKQVLMKMGGKYRLFANSPENPQYN